MPATRASTAAPEIPTQSEVSLFRTQTINFAAYLIACNILKFVRCENASRNLQVVLQDPDGQGMQLYAQFLTSDPKVPLKAFMAIRGMLLDEGRKLGWVGGGNRVDK